MATVFLLANTCFSASQCVRFSWGFHPYAFSLIAIVPLGPVFRLLQSQVVILCPPPPTPRPTPSQRYPLTYFGLKRPFARHAESAVIAGSFTFLLFQQILTNRAIARSRLGDVQEARDDFLMALQSKFEPRHRIIEDLLLCWQVSHALD